MRSPARGRERERRRRSPRFRRWAWGLLGMTLVGAVLATAYTATSGLPVINYYTVFAQFRDASNLSPYSQVRIAGKRVGQVLSVSFENGVATAALQLDPSERYLPADTSASIRYQSLIGAKLVSLSPGDSRRDLRDGATIPITRTSTSVDLSSITALFNPTRQAEFQTTFGTLGAGLLGRGADLNTALAAAAPLTQEVTSLADAINARTGAAARLAPAAESTAAAIAPVAYPLASTFAPAADVFGTIAAQAPALKNTLHLAPPALTGLRTALVAANPLLDQTIALSHEVLRASRVAPASLIAATQLLRTAPRPLALTRKLLVSLDTALPSNDQLLTRLQPLITPTGRALGSLQPILNQLSASGCDITGLAANLHAITKFGVQTDGDPEPQTLVRVELGTNQSAAGDVPKESPPLLGIDAYPKPCAGVNQVLAVAP